MSTQIEGTPVKGMPEDLTEQGWQLFLSDSMKFRARHEARNEETFPVPTATEAIEDARALQVEFAEADAIRDEAPEAERVAAEGRLWSNTPAVDETVATEANRLIEEAKESPVAQRTIELTGDVDVSSEEPPPRKGFEPYTTILAAHTIFPEVALQMREGGLNMLVVAEYAEAMKAGAKFPPVDVFYDGEIYLLAGGAHRHQSTIEAGLTELLTTVHSGTKRDALIFAAGENATHGLQRSNADKRLAVTALLTDAEWVTEADSVIAKHAGVSQPFVGGIRHELETQNIISPQTKRRGKDRIVRDTSNIGARDEAEAQSANDRQTTLADIDGVDLPDREEKQEADGSLAKCLECGCTDETPCEGGCAWVPGEDLCTSCLDHKEQTSESEGTSVSPAMQAVQRSSEIFAALERHGGVLMRMQLEDMGFKYDEILSAVNAGAILQPETGKFTLPDHKPQSSESRQTPAGASAKPKPSIEEILKGQMLSVTFTWIPAMKGKVSVIVNATTDKFKAMRKAIDAGEIRGFSAPVMDLIFEHLREAPAKAKLGARIVKKKPATKKPARKPAAKKKAVAKKPTKKSAAKKARKR